MEIPAELRRDPPPEALRWVAGAIGPGAQVTAVRRLRNAWAAAVHAIDVDDTSGVRHELVLRRYARTDMPPDEGVIENEASVLGFLAASEYTSPQLIVPTLIAADPDGTAADVPALVMSRLAGRDDLAPADLATYLDGLVETLHAIHAVEVPVGTFGEYRPWGLDAMREPPPWTTRPDVWRRAYEISHRPIPVHTARLCHRDFHAGNVLWAGGRVTGVVDWTDTCRGPAAADVAHCCSNLAVLFGIDAAADFARRYGAVDDLAWFEVADVAGWGALDAWRWHDAGRTDLNDELMAARFDEFITAAVERAW